jgi:hypothetical protein
MCSFSSEGFDQAGPGQFVMAELVCFLGRTRSAHRRVPSDRVLRFQSGLAGWCRSRWLRTYPDSLLLRSCEGSYKSIYRIKNRLPDYAIQIVHTSNRAMVRILGRVSQTNMGAHREVGDEPPGCPGVSYVRLGKLDPFISSRTSCSGNCPCRAAKLATPVFNIKPSSYSSRRNRTGRLNSPYGSR